MYSLDINFLKDRDPQLDAGPRSAPMPKGSMRPLIIGVVVGLLLPTLVGGMWLFLQQQIAQKETDKANLDSQLAQLQVEEKKIAQINEQTAKVNEDTAALASVFDQIKPWSAMLQDIRERIPPGVQILSIQQSSVAAAPATNPPAAAKGKAAPKAKASPNAQAANEAQLRPTMKLEIKGKARSFDDVNYFLLTLQRSAFLKREETQLVKAELIKDSDKIIPRDSTLQRSDGGTYELPKSVGYVIQTDMNDVRSSELLRELDRKGAVGLVTRIKTLQEKGVIQP